VGISQLESSVPLNSGIIDPSLFNTDQMANGDVLKDFIDLKEKQAIRLLVDARKFLVLNHAKLPVGLPDGRYFTGLASILLLI